MGQSANHLAAGFFALMAQWEGFDTRTGEAWRDYRHGAVWERGNTSAEVRHTTIG